MRSFFPFVISDQLFALPLGAIDTVVRAVDLLRLPDAAYGFLGLIDMRGKLLPVIDMRLRLNIPPLPLQVDQRIVITESDNRVVAFVADHVEAVLTVAEDKIQHASEIYPAMDQYVSGITWLGERKVLICDPETFLHFDRELIENVVREQACEVKASL